MTRKEVNQLLEILNLRERLVVKFAVLGGMRPGEIFALRRGHVTANYADVPVYHVTGWYDSWTRQVTLNWQALSKTKRAPQRLIIGPWTHAAQTS